MGRDFSVACPPEEQEDLLDAARYLDRRGGPGQTAFAATVAGAAARRLDKSQR